MDAIDPSVKALVTAIGRAETGSAPDAYAKRGASGEYGRYQFTPDTWRAYAAEAGVTTPLERASVDEQNRVAYQKVAKWKAGGYTPAQIASMWNAGEGNPDAYKQNWRGVNAHGVEYDTPAYALKVSEHYRQLAGSGASGSHGASSGYNPKPFSNPDPSSPIAAAVEQAKPQPATQPAQASSPSLYSSLQADADDNWATKAGKWVGRFGLDVTKPIATMLARPVQVGQALLGQSVEEQATVPGLSSVYGKFSVPTAASDVAKDVGRGLQTVAFGVGPAAAGALYGGGAALEKGKEAGQVARDAAVGALGGKIAAGAASLAAKTVGAIGSRIAPGVSDVVARGASAVDDVAGATKEAVLDKLPFLRRNLPGDFVNRAMAFPGKVKDSLMGRALNNQAASRALGVTASDAKSAGTLSKLASKRAEGIDVLSDMTDNVQVTSPEGILSPYRPHEPGTTFTQHAEALAQGKKAIWDALAKVQENAGKFGSTVNLSPASSALRREAAKLTRDAGLKSRALELADQLDEIAAAGQNTPAGVQELLTDLNSRLRGVFSGGASSVSKEADVLAVRAISDALDSTVERASGQVGKFLRGKYAALKSVEDALVRRARQEASRMGAGLDDYVTPFNVVDALSFLADPLGAAKGAARSVLQQKLASTKDRGEAIRSIFESLAREKGLIGASVPSRFQSAVGASTAQASQPLLDRI